jgi:hypothetical protein
LVERGDSFIKGDYEQRWKGEFLFPNSRVCLKRWFMQRGFEMWAKEIAEEKEGFCSQPDTWFKKGLSFYGEEV